jgi:UDP:flavonoid glycosyltransferase YjiC (YdhE family)
MVPQAGMTAATLRAAAQDLLADHRYRQAAAAIGGALDRLPDVGSAVDLLESLAG